MKRLAALLGLVALTSTAAEYRTLKPETSRLSFAYTQMGVPLEGQFKKFSAILHFDPAHPTAAQAQFEVDLASIDTGSDDANREVAGKAWFNTATYPSARFVSSAIKVLGPNRYEVQGALTLKGRTVNVTAPFTFTPQGDLGHFVGAFTLKRLDYAIGEGAWADVSAVANEVQIKFQLAVATAAARQK